MTVAIATVSQSPRSAAAPLCLYGDDADVAAERLRAAGATEVREPTDQPWGERMCVGPGGHLIHVGAVRSVS